MKILDSNRRIDSEDSGGARMLRYVLRENIYTECFEARLFHRARDSVARERAKMKERERDSCESQRESGVRRSTRRHVCLPAIHATPVNTRCTFNARVMVEEEIVSRVQHIARARARMNPCTENTRLSSNGGGGGSMLNYFDRVSRTLFLVQGFPVNREQSFRKGRLKFK